MFPTIFVPTAPVTVRRKTYHELTFSRPAGLAELGLYARFKDPKRRACAVMGQLAGVPAAVIAALSDQDFVRLERETRHLFTVA